MGQNTQHNAVCFFEYSTVRADSRMSTDSSFLSFNAFCVINICYEWFTFLTKRL